MVNANSSQIMNGVGEHFDPKKKGNFIPSVTWVSRPMGI